MSIYFDPNSRKAREVPANGAAAPEKKKNGTAPSSAPSVPGRILDIALALTMVGATNAYGAEPAEEQPDLNLLEGYINWSDQNAGTSTLAPVFISGKEKATGFLHSINPLNKEVTEDKMIGLDVFQCSAPTAAIPIYDIVSFDNSFIKTSSPRRDAFITRYFNNRKDYPLLYNVNLILTKLYVDPQGAALQPSNPSELLRNFQDNCNRNGIWAKIFKTLPTGRASEEYMRVQPDKKIGKQTVRAMVFVYELGQLSIRFGLVKNFDEYRKVFSDPRKFKNLVDRFKVFVMSNRPGIGYQVGGNNPFSFDVPRQQEVMEALGVVFTIYKNVGDAIIKVYGLGDNKLVQADLKNIAEQDPNKVMIVRAISPEDTVSIPDLPGVFEAKKILFSCRRADNSRFYPLTLENFDGSWSTGDPFDAALREALSIPRGWFKIDDAISKKLNDMCSARLEYIRKMLTLEDPTLKNINIDKDLLAKWNDRRREILATSSSQADALYLIDRDIVRGIEEKLAEFYAAKVEALKEGLNGLTDRLNALEASIFDNTGGAIPTDINNPSYRSANTVRNFTEVKKRITPNAGSDSTTLNRNTLRLNGLTKSLPVKADYLGIAVAGSEIVNTIDSLARFRGLIDPAAPANAALPAGALGYITTNFGNLKMRFENDVEALRKALQVRIDAINADIAARKRAVPAPVIHIAAAAPVPVEPPLPPLAFVIGDADFVDVNESETVGKSRKFLHYLDFIDIKMEDAAKLSNTPYVAAISAPTYIENNGDLLGVSKSVRRFYASVAAILANKGQFEQLLAEAKRMFDAKKEKIVHNQDAILAPQKIKILKALNFEDCLMAELTGRRLSYAGVALAQAFYNTLSDEERSKTKIPMDSDDILFTGVPTIVLDPLAKFVGLEN